MPGGRIAPDGRPPQAPGVGANSKRHDLEAPATPPVHGSDLQVGDAKRLQQAQQVAPRPKGRGTAARPAPAPRRRGVQRGSGQYSMEVPDPIEMLARRGGGNVPGQLQGTSTTVDPSPWMPFLRMAATAPNAGGGLMSGLIDAVGGFVRQPQVSEALFINLNELDDVLEQ